MNPIDILVLILIGTFAVLGLRRGFLLGLLDLVIVAVSLMATARVYPGLVENVVDRGFPRSFAAPVAFIVVFGVVLFVGSFLAGLLLNPISRVPWPPPFRWADNVLGVIPGAVKGLALAAVVVVPLVFFQLSWGLRQTVVDSRLTDPVFRAGVNALENAISLTGIDPKLLCAGAPPDEESTPLPGKVTVGLVTDPQSEQELLQLVNQARTDAGMKPLEFDQGLTEVGRDHSSEMFQLGYFSHESPVSGSPCDRIAEARVPFMVMGENIALAPTIPIAHQNLMNSPGHRANILNPAYTRIGIGVVRSPDAGLMISQEFAS